MANKNLQSQRTLTPDQLQAIGIVAVESTYLEGDIEELIWHLAGLSYDNGKFFTDNLRLKARIELLGDLWKKKTKDQKQLQELTALISDLKIAADDRNTIIHGVWTRYGSFRTGDFVVADKRRLRSPPLQFSPANILKTAEQIAMLHETLATLAYRELGWSSSSSV